MEPCYDEKNVKFITLTNTGYIDYTLNCLKSLELINFKNTLHCYVLGQEGHNILQSHGYKSILLKSDDKDTHFTKHKSENWNSITKRKFEIIYNELIENKFVCITDGDIVFLNQNFMNYCLDYIQDNDLVIQNDKMHDSKCDGLCSGFMFIKSSKKTIDLFNPQNIRGTNIKSWDDQKYVNKIKSKLKYIVLPLALFPNGKYYMRNHKKLKPMMIHFNWLIGQHKKRYMIKYNKWYRES